MVLLITHSLSLPTVYINFKDAKRMEGIITAGKNMAALIMSHVRYLKLRLQLIKTFCAPTMPKLDVCPGCAPN